MILQVGVKALIKNDKGQYLFLRRSERMQAETEPHWDIPGGRIDPAERLEQAGVVGATFSGTLKKASAKP